jgi:glycosyltransferase involved in cell wall biosynthesis
VTFVANITFACGTPHGGAVDSTLSLAEQAVRAGHQTQLILPAKDPYQTGRRAMAGLVRLQRLSQRLGQFGWTFHDRLAGIGRSEKRCGVEVVTVHDVPAAVRRRHRPGDLIVVNSMRRLDLDRVTRLAQETGSPVCWYLREDSSLVHAAEVGTAVDVLIANSEPLAAAAEEIAGRRCHFVPSALSLDGLESPVHRKAILLINIQPGRGVDEAISLGRQLPDQHIVLQESWPLDEPAMDHLLTQISGLSNVEVRRRAPRSTIYRDTRIMIAPHAGASQGLHRPRVALETQALGIPMIATDTPGLAAVAASTDLLIPSGSPIDRWIETVQRVDEAFDRYSRAAAEYAKQELKAPSEIWNLFAKACELTDPSVTP